MENKLTIAEASRLMGATPQFIRLGLQKGVLPFGFAVQMSPNRYTYYISREKFAEYLGIKIKGERNGKIPSQSASDAPTDEAYQVDRNDRRSRQA